MYAGRAVHMSETWGMMGMLACVCSCAASELQATSLTEKEQGCGLLETMLLHL
jgi:hypothetical protein